MPSLVDPNAPRLLLDSSVVLSGITSKDGASYALLRLAEIGLVRLLSIPYIMDEVESNLEEKAMVTLPGFEQIRTAVAWEMLADPTPEEVSAVLAFIRAKDAPVLAAAIAAHPVRLVSLDKRDFLRQQGEIAARTLVRVARPGEVMQSIREAIAAAFAPRQNGL